jgi:hypothetical protein
MSVEINCDECRCHMNDGQNVYCEDCLDSAKTEAFEKGKDEGYKDGKKDGYDEGYKDGKEQSSLSN